MNDVEEKQPWEQLPGENALWYGRFRDWLKLGKSRSVLAIYNAEKVRKGEKKRETFPPSWANARKQHHWNERAAAWDQAQREAQDREWAALREQEMRDELAYAEILRQKSLAMLALPEVVEEVKRNRAGEEVGFFLIPEFRAFKAASDMLGQAKDHARLALGMPTSHRELNLKNLSVEDLYALAERFGRNVSLGEGAVRHSPGTSATESTDPNPEDEP